MSWVRSSGGHQVKRVAALPSFFTTFTGNENPLSEGGNWNGKPVPAVFTNAVQKSGGAAFDGGTATSVNDAVAVVTTQAFNPVSTRVRATATLKVTGAIGAAEVELCFNNNFTATNITQYELDMTNGGVLSVKWLGTQGSIFFPLSVTGGTGGWAGGTPPISGDIIKAERTDNGLSGASCVVTLKLWHIPLTDRGSDLAGVSFLMVQCQDSFAISGTNAYTTGQPAIGFDNGASEFALDDYRCENF